MEREESIGSSRERRVKSMCRNLGIDYDDNNFENNISNITTECNAFELDGDIDDKIEKLERFIFNGEGKSGGIQ